MTWLLVYYLFRIIRSWTWLFIYLWLFTSSLSGSKLSSISSLNLINQFVLHRIPWFVCTWTRNNFIIIINQARESIIIIIFFYCFTFKYSRLYLFIILTRANFSSLFRFIDESFAWYTKWTFLTVVRFEHLYGWCDWDFICTRARGRVVNVLYWIVIWRVITNMSWWWSLLWVNSTLCWILCYSWLFYILFYCSIWYVAFSLIHWS
jgi:hypothetical protein